MQPHLHGCSTTTARIRNLSSHSRRCVEYLLVYEEAKASSIFSAEILRSDHILKGTKVENGFVISLFFHLHHTTGCASEPQDGQDIAGIYLSALFTILL
jgi:hypothetical protein